MAFVIDRLRWPVGPGFAASSASSRTYCPHLSYYRRAPRPHLSAASEYGSHRAGVTREQYTAEWWPTAQAASQLAPIYLQLLEGLRRVTDGQRGAGLCRECGQPFLTLDARRSSFCTDRERFRFSQRERRKRLGATASAPVQTHQSELD